MGLSSYQVYNMAVSGETTVQRIADAAATDALYRAGRTNIAVLWEIRNHLAVAGASEEEAKTAYQTWCNGRRAAGFTVVAVTLLPSTASGTWDETVRQSINTWLRANYTDFADALADVAADNRIGDAGDNLDATYYGPSGIHLTTAGDQIVADIVKATLETLI